MYLDFSEEIQKIAAHSNTAVRQFSHMRAREGLEDLQKSERKSAYPVAMGEAFALGTAIPTAFGIPSAFHRGGLDAAAGKKMEVDALEAHFRDLGAGVHAPGLARDVQRTQAQSMDPDTKEFLDKLLKRDYPGKHRGSRQGVPRSVYEDMLTKGEGLLKRKGKLRSWGPRGMVSPKDVVVARLAAKRLGSLLSKSMPLGAIAAGGAAWGVRSKKKKLEELRGQLRGRTYGR